MAWRNTKERPPLGCKCTIIAERKELRAFTALHRCQNGQLTQRNWKSAQWRRRTMSQVQFGAILSTATLGLYKATQLCNLLSRWVKFPIVYLSITKNSLKSIVGLFHELRQNLCGSQPVIGIIITKFVLIHKLITETSIDARVNKVYIFCYDISSPYYNIVTCDASIMVILSLS